jgi:nitrogen fixation protein FixH
MTARTRWVGAIVGLLVANVLAMVVLLGAAHTGRSQVIPDYYERAVNYDDAIDQAARNRALGWQVTAAWNGIIVADVRDRDGQPLLGAAVEIEQLPRVQGQRRGLHDVTIIVTRGADRFVERTIVETR